MADRPDCMSERVNVHLRVCVCVIFLAISCSCIFTHVLAYVCMYYNFIHSDSFKCLIFHVFVLCVIAKTNFIHKM